MCLICESCTYFLFICKHCDSLPSSPQTTLLHQTSNTVAVKGIMHHNLAQKLCEVLGKLRQLLGLPPGPTGGLPSPRAPCMCHLSVPLILNRDNLLNKSWRRPPRLIHQCDEITVWRHGKFFRRGTFLAAKAAEFHG